MRKITLILTLVAFTAFAFAQTSPEVMFKYSKAIKCTDVSSLKPTTTNDAKDGNTAWQVTFEESTPIWTIGHNSGSIDWFVGGAADVPEVWGDYESGLWYISPLGDLSLTGNNIDGKWAMLDIIGLHDAGAQESGEYWIRFDNIDLSAVAQPKLEFYQRFRKLNTVYAYIDISIDGGNTWLPEPIEPNFGVNNNVYADVKKEIIIAQYVANQPNVSLRFRWETDVQNPNAPYGYGWQLDDISIVDAPAKDFKLIKAHMNFFNYEDYTQYADHRGFHFSTHYGQTPIKQFDSEWAYMVFNPIVENKGYEPSIPSIEITVIDPNGAEVYNEVQTFAEIAPGDIDTLDFLEPEFFIDNPEFGEYTVTYRVFGEGIDDPSNDDNWDVAYFRISENTFAKDLNNMTGYVGPSNWVGGGLDGEQIGTIYRFLYNTEITAIEVFISPNSDAGTSLMGYIYIPDSEGLTEAASTEYIDIEEEDLGTWMTLNLADIVNIDLDGYDAFEIIVAIEFNYNDANNNLYIGTDNSVPTSLYCAYWKFVDDEDFGPIGNWAPSSLGLRVITSDISGETIALFTSNRTEIYEGQNIEFTSLSVGATEYAWTFEGGDPATSENPNPIVTYNDAGTFDVTLQVTGPNGTDTKVIPDYITVEIDLTKISGSTLETVKVYPNPATDIINVDVQNLQSLRVYNTVGQVVFEGNVNTIDVSNWTNGWYVLEVKTMDNVIRTNIVVQ